MNRRAWLVLALVVSLILTAVGSVAAEGGGYAVDWVDGQTHYVTNPSYALAAPDGLYATFSYGGQIMLDMGVQVSGPLVIYSATSGRYMPLQLFADLASEQVFNGSYVESPTGSFIDPGIPFRYVILWDGTSTSTGTGIDAVFGGPVLPAPVLSATVKDGRTPTYTVLATVTDSDGNLMTKAVVSAEWTTSAGPVSASATARKGIAKFTIRGEAQTLCVTGITGAGMLYWPDLAVDPCIAMPPLP